MPFKENVGLTQENCVDFSLFIGGEQAQEKGPEYPQKTNNGTFGPVGPENRDNTHKNWNQELADWVLGLEPSDLPPTPFEIRPGSKITDSRCYLKQLQGAVACGPDHPRNHMGGLESDMQQLHQLLHEGV